MPSLGIDTSCYTTSVALVDGETLVADLRQVLAVPQGGRGLQQSNALFQHVQNLPVLIEGLGLNKFDIQSVAVSARPRPAEDSYMPVFTAGVSIARALASALGAPYFETSHQEGHIAAGCFSLPWKPDNAFLAFHISGGTTEILRAEPLDAGFRVEILGCSKDLHAGQFVDRVGVALGMTFPAGPALEKLAARYTGKPGALPIKANVSGTDCSLSGAESAAQRLISSGAEGPAVAFETLHCLAGAFAAMTVEASKRTGLREALFIGGVASNEYIRGHLEKTLANAGIAARFARNPLSSDNAVGVAAIGHNFIRKVMP